MYCSNCGKPIREGSKFCGSCGTPVGTECVDMAETAPHNTGAKRVLKKNRVVGICVIVAVAVIGIICVRYKSNQTIFTQYLYMEGKDYTELMDDYEKTDVSDTGQTASSVMTKSVDIGTTSWAVVNIFYTYISDTLEMEAETGKIQSTYFSLSDRWRYEDSYILSEIEDIYGEYDYVSYSDSLADYGKSSGLYYVSYQWDGVENADYDVELLILDEDISLYFIPGDSKNNSDPFAVLDEFNDADNLYRALNYVEWESEDEKEAAINHMNVDPQDLEVEVELISSVRLSRSYASYIWSNVLDYDAIDFPDSSEIYIGYALLTAIQDEEYDIIYGYVVIGFYDGEWKIYDISDSDWSNSLFLREK